MAASPTVRRSKRRRSACGFFVGYKCRYSYRAVNAAPSEALAYLWRCVLPRIEQVLGHFRQQCEGARHGPRLLPKDDFVAESEDFDLPTYKMPDLRQTGCGLCARSLYRQ
jgi:hypothetical protein